jgi:lipopolysaccharide transport system ATP-binding protein
MTQAIKAENISKVFYIKNQTSQHVNYSEKLNNFTRLTWMRSKYEKAIKKGSNFTEPFWALKDVNFELNHGEKLGIIGKNGAGKSTILKILSQVMVPTSGKIGINGRLASLLEVGTGFHPELTGRENIYLNGAILGMTKNQIKAKFDEIVDFAEIEYFLDTPVKRYSSGMYIRLAFAIAAQLDCEILIVDEVLAVGDVLFQKKCLRKMDDVSSEGRTIIFVSHNMKAVSSLCTNAMHLMNGTVKDYGKVDDVISKYLYSTSEENSIAHEQEIDKSIHMCLINAEIVCDNKSGIISNQSHITIILKYAINKKVKASHVYLCVLTLEDVVVFGSSDCDVNSERFNERVPGIYECNISLPIEMLNEGSYKINVTMGVPYGEIYQSNLDVLQFKVVIHNESDNYTHQKRAGLLRHDIPWIYD